MFILLTKIAIKLRKIVSFRRFVLNVFLLFIFLFLNFFLGLYFSRAVYFLYARVQMRVYTVQTHSIEFSRQYRVVRCVCCDVRILVVQVNVCKGLNDQIQKKNTNVHGIWFYPKLKSQKISF